MLDTRERGVLRTIGDDIATAPHFDAQSRVALQEFRAL